MKFTKKKMARKVANRLLGKKVTERIKTTGDVLLDNDLIQTEFDVQCRGLEDDEVAYRIIKLLAKSLNEGWTPDWSDHDQYKYTPYFEMRGSSGFRFDGDDAWDSGSDVGSRLCFKTQDLAKYAGTQFRDVYERFMT